jgi:isoquinoline 1-oxidoreductase beta subunit
VDGTIGHPSGRQSGFGAFAAKAARQRIPSEVRLKDPSAWKLIGNPGLRRLDAAAKSTGRQQFTIDVMLPGMLVATVAHPPRFGGKVRSFDASGAKKIKGVVDVVEIPRGVAVVATNTWAAIKGKRALQVEWDESGAETRGSQELLDHYRAALEHCDAVIARSDGAADRALADAATIVEAQFEFPYLAHAALEPLNAVAPLLV